MADITMCTGKDCPFKDTCYRYMANACKYRQSYFVNVPYDAEKEECTTYWKVDDEK